MIVKCNICKTTLQLDESFIKEKGSKVRCSACKNVFQVYHKRIFGVKCKKCQTILKVDQGLVKEEGLLIRCSICKHTFKLYPPVFAGKKKPLPKPSPEIAKPKLILPRVWISCGTDISETLGLKLKHDLEERGIEVFFDRSRLAQKTYERKQYIEDALEWLSINPLCSHVVFLMTHQAVKRPDGECLYELSHAISRGFSIIPVMASVCDIPPILFAIPWLEMNDCMPVEYHETRYLSKLQRLMSRLQTGRPDYDEIPYLLFSKLEPSDTPICLSNILHGFIERTSAMEKIRLWLKNPQSSKILHITGKTGTGKTSLAYWLAHTLPDVAVFYSLNETGFSIREFIRTMVAQLAVRFPKYREKVLAENPQIYMGIIDPRSLFEYLVVSLLDQDDIGSNQPVIAIIDGIDKAGINDENPFVSFFADEFFRILPCFQWIITSSDNAEVRRGLKQFEPIVVDLSLDENRLDIEKYLQKHLKPFVSDENAIATIISKSDSQFLYAELIHMQSIANYPNIEPFENFPSGVFDLYTWIFQRLFPDNESYCLHVKPLTNILIASQKPLETEMFVRMVQLGDDYRIRRFIGVFLKLSGDRVRFVHESLYDWLTDETKSGIYAANQSEGHNLLADHGWQEYRDGVSQLSDYMLKYLPFHLCMANRFQELTTILTDLNFIDKKCSKNLALELLEDFNFALQRLPENQAEIRRESENTERIRAYIRELDIASKKDIFNPKPVISAQPYNEERMKRKCEHLINTPNRFGQLLGFFNFVCRKRDILNQFQSIQGFCIQEAYNDSKASPVSEIAEKVINSSKNMRYILLTKQYIPDYTPYPALLHTMQGHTNWVTSVDITPDGTVAVSGSVDETIRVWSVKSGECVRVLYGHWDLVRCVGITPDGQTAISGSQDRTVRIWDLSRGVCIKTFSDHTEGVNSVHITPDATRAISASSDRTIRFWDIKKGKCTHTILAHDGNIHTVNITPNGKRVTSAGSDNMICVWNAETGEAINAFECPIKTITQLSLTPDGRCAVSVSNDKTIHLWNLDTGDYSQFPETPSSIFSIKITPDGRHALASCTDKSLRVFNVKTGECIKTILTYGRRIETVATTVDARYAITGGMDNTVKFWNIESGQVTETKNIGTHRISSIGLSKDLKLAVSSSLNNLAYVWNPENIETKRKLEGHTDWIESIKIFPDGKKAVTGSRDHSVRVWDIVTGECIQTLKGHTDHVYDVCIARENPTRLVSVGKDKTIRVWDLETSRCVNIIKGHALTVCAIDITPDGMVAVTGSRDCTVRIWNIETGECEKVLKGHSLAVECVKIGSDKRFVISGSRDKTIRIWNLESGQCSGILYGHSGWVKCLSLRLDEQEFISGSWDKTIRLWDTNTGKCKALFPADSSITALSEIGDNGNFLYGTKAGNVIGLKT